MNQQVVNAFFLGIAFTMSMVCGTQDYLGLEGYITYLRCSWIAWPWQLSAAFALISLGVGFLLAKVADRGETGNDLSPDSETADRDSSHRSTSHMQRGG
jgi:hypothetical protein